MWKYSYNIFNQKRDHLIKYLVKSNNLDNYEKTFPISITPEIPFGLLVFSNIKTEILLILGAQYLGYIYTRNGKFFDW